MVGGDDPKAPTLGSLNLREICTANFHNYIGYVTKKTYEGQFH